MKLKSLPFFVALVSIITLSSCKDDDNDPCESLMQKVSDTGRTYSENPTDENCVIYRDAIKAAIQNKCVGLTLQEQLDSLPCK